MSKSIPTNKRLKKIKMLLLNVDGVMTDGSIYYSVEGVEMKAFNAQDGYGIVRAKELGLQFAIVTGRQTAIVTRRAEALGIPDVYQNHMDKVGAFEDIKRKYGLADEEVAFIGDDSFDLPLLEKVGVSVAPKNAVHDVRERVDFVTKAKGGKGAVREVIDLILRAQGKI